MKALFKYYFLIICILFPACSAGTFTNYITAEKDKLMDGDEELRFVSFNIPNLHYIEDHLDFKSSNPFRLPDEFEIRDALNAIKQLGGKVARMYVLSVRKQGESLNIIRHVEGPGIFNEDAFKALDKVMQIANETGIRVIIPFVDNWWWWGGPLEYSAFRDREKELFWTDPEIISDFKKTIGYLVNRRNTYTGILYKDDKALLGWETGNELEAPYTWTAEIAHYIKSIDQNHLVIEGTHNKTLTDDAINDVNIDVLSTHHYTRAEESLKRIRHNKELSKGKKPYFVGEFGLVPPADIKTIVDSTIDIDVSGIMIWSLRFHNKDGGFYLHRENTGSGPYRFPGFASGNLYYEKEIIHFMREKAFAVDGKEIPALEIPDAPVLLDIKNVFDISWQGSVGAASYILERTENDKESWVTIEDNLSDADGGYRPLFNDTTALPGSEYYYRVIAKNESGRSVPSNEVGPVKVNSLKIVDELNDYSKIFSKEGTAEIVNFKDIYRAKEDNGRLKVDSTTSIIYSIPQNTLSFKMQIFIPDSTLNVKFFASDTTNYFIPLTLRTEVIPPYKNEYKFFTPAILSCEEFPPGSRYIKISFGHEAQISRTEIEYKLMENKK